MRDRNAKQTSSCHVAYKKSDLTGKSPYQKEALEVWKFG